MVHFYGATEIRVTVYSSLAHVFIRKNNFLQRQIVVIVAMLDKFTKICTHLLKLVALRYTACSVRTIGNSCDYVALLT